jgi:hypothetical protein
MLLGFLMYVGLGVSPVLSQDVATPGALVGPTGNPPEKMLKRMKSAPEAFVTDAAEMILGYGVNGGIDAAGIDMAIAVDRAAARGREMGRLLQADLDADGSANAQEIAVLVQAASAKGRARVAMTFETADTDADGTVTGSEMQMHAAKVGADAISPAKAAALAGLMVLDADADGILTLAEVRAAVARARQAI